MLRINIVRVDDSLLIYNKRIVVQFAKETACISFVACGTELLDFEQDAISIAIDSDLDDPLAMSTFFALSPKLVSRSTKVSRIA